MFSGRVGMRGAADSGMVPIVRASFRPMRIFTTMVQICTRWSVHTPVDFRGRVMCVCVAEVAQKRTM